MKVRALLALAVLMSVAALLGSSGPGEEPQADASVSTSVTLTLPGFFRGR